MGPVHQVPICLGAADCAWWCDIVVEEARMSKMDGYKETEIPKLWQVGHIKSLCICINVKEPFCSS